MMDFWFWLSFYAAVMSTVAVATNIILSTRNYLDRKKRKEASLWGKSAKFIITATTNDDFQTVSVKVESEGDSDLFTLRICACEYFMNMTAKQSHLSYDMALSMLCSGSKQYDDRVIRLPDMA